MGKDWDQRIETDGWIFVQKGNSYAAVRPVMWDEQYEKEPNHDIFFDSSKIADDPCIQSMTCINQLHEFNQLLCRSPL